MYNNLEYIKDKYSYIIRRNEAKIAQYCSDLVTTANSATVINNLIYISIK